MIEIQDLAGVQKKMSSLGGPTLKKKKKRKKEKRKKGSVSNDKLMLIGIV